MMIMMMRLTMVLIVGDGGGDGDDAIVVANCCFARKLILKITRMTIQNMRLRL